MERCTDNLNIYIYIMYWNEKDNISSLIHFSQQRDGLEGWYGLEFHHCIQTGSISHLASDLMGAGGCDKVNGGWTDHSLNLLHLSWDKT
jgi:hypothetical protein